MGSVTAQATRVLVIEPVEHQVAALKNYAGNGLDVVQCGQMGTRTAKVRFQGLKSSARSMSAMKPEIAEGARLLGSGGRLADIYQGLTGKRPCLSRSSLSQIIAPRGSWVD